MQDQIDSLPVLQRLALSYAPGAVRQATLGLFALDHRLGNIVRKASEPMLGQIKLAWWRELLARSPQDWPAGEPLLELLQHWGQDARTLVTLVDGWENCVSADGLTATAIEAAAAGRGNAFAALAEKLDCAPETGSVGSMGRAWALADMAAGLREPKDRETARALLNHVDWEHRRLPRALRPLVVLHGLAERAGRKQTDIDALRGAGLICAMRLGLFGS